MRSDSTPAIIGALVSCRAVRDSAARAWVMGELPLSSPECFLARNMRDGPRLVNGARSFGTGSTGRLFGCDPESWRGIKDRAIHMGFELGEIFNEHIDNAVRRPVIGVAVSPSGARVQNC